MDLYGWNAPKWWLCEHLYDIGVIYVSRVACNVMSPTSLHLLPPSLSSPPFPVPPLLPSLGSASSFSSQLVSPQYIYWIGMWVTYLGLLGASVYSLNDYLERAKKKRKKGASSVDLKIVVYVLNMVLCVTRLIWILDPNPVSKPFGVKLWRTSL